MSPARRLAVLFCIVASVAGALLWLRTRPGGSGATSPERQVASASAALPANEAKAAPPSTGAATPVAPAPSLRFGEHGSVTLAEIPAGRFQRELAALSPDAQQRALAKLGARQVPRHDVASLRVDRHGRLIYHCPPPAATQLEAALVALDQDNGTEKIALAAKTPEAAAVPIGSPPVRHSRAGATKVIYLDFNGHTITGTAWNEGEGAEATYVALPYDSDGNPATFSDGEQAMIVEVWARIAEDFAPFDVDVTTEQPATFTNQTGTILFTKSTDGANKAMPDSAVAGGVAYMDVFGDANYAHLSPTLVYFDKYYNDAGNLADAGSHEMGHNLALSHDGSTSDEYYAGHSYWGTPSWGPLMGSPYYSTLTQWSKGEYLNANNNQDDLATIASDLGYRPDDHADSNVAATLLTGSGTASLSGSGVIETTGDNDRFTFTCAKGMISFDAVSRPVPNSTQGMNVDLALELYDAAGNLLLLADDSERATQNLVYGVNAGTYYLRVKGVGCGSPYALSPTGYTAYGSLGRYALTGTFGPGTAPQIYSNPSAANITAGQPATFFASSSGAPRPTVQWQRLPTGSTVWEDVTETASYTGVTSTYLTVNSATLAMNGDQFRAVATNIAGTATSTAATLTVNAAQPPGVVYGPYNTSTTAGTSTSFSVNPSGSWPLTLRWQRLPAGGGPWTDIANGSPYSGVDNTTLSISSTTLAMNGDQFQCIVSNVAGSVTSSAATLTVTPVIAPTVSGLPSILSVAYGDSLYLSPSISGTWPITFQWFLNNEPIANATSQYFSRSNNTLAHGGTYVLKATNSAGTTSAEVQVTIGTLVGLVVTQPPASTEVVKSNSVSFSISVTGSQPITYQWRRNGVPLAYGTQSYYSISSVTAADAGDYTVVVTNDAGSIISSAATLTVLPAELPKFTGWSPNSTISTDSSLNLYASVSGAGPMTYQWFKDGVAIPGATSSNYYSYSNLSPANAGVYTLQVSNEAGTVMSPDAVVTWLNGTASLPWLGVRRQGDIAYFLMVTPGRILRYDLAQETWLPTVYLSETKVPTAFLPTAEGVFIAYNKELVRRSLDLQGETPVGTSAAAINVLFAAGDLIYFREGDNYTTNLRSFNRTTLAAGPGSNPGPYAFTGLTGSSPVVFSALSGKVFTKAYDVERFTVATDGTITSNGDSPYHGDFRMGSALTLFPDESQLISNAGVIYSNPDLKYQGTVGQAYDDIAFMADGSIVALRGRKLMAHAGVGWVETARAALASDGAALFCRSDKLFVFGAPATTGGSPAVQKASASSFTVPTVPVPGSALARKVSLDGIFLDASKVINIVSRSEQGIVRWDTVTRQFLPTRPLRGRPYLTSYAPAFDRLVLTYSDGTLTDLFPTSDPVEQAFANYPLNNQPLGMIAMDDLVALNIRQADSSGNLRLVLGTQGETKFLSSWNYWTPFDHWVSPARRVYSLSTDYYTNGGGSYEDVPVTGVLPISPGGTGTNLAGPLRSNPEGTLLLSLNGRVFNADLQQTGLLDNKVADGVWLSDALYTIRVRPDGTQLQKWTRITYALSGQLKLQGIPQRIFRLDDSNLVVVTTVDGYLVFNLVSSALEQVATVANDPAFLPDRPALFNAEVYLANNADVAASIGNPPDRAQRAWAHYWKNGVTEGRTDGDFNVKTYLAQYPNLAAIYGTDLKGAALHWYTVGRPQGLRIPTGFDVVAYLARHLDIYALFKNDKYGAWLHFFNYGLNEGRDFDANFIVDEYLELNPDIKAAFGTNRQAALLHWFQYGHPIEDRMGRVPIGFNVDNYLARYPDLNAALGGITPRAVRNVTAWHQYLAYGVLESRSDGDFEANAYLASNPDLAAVYGTDVRGAALHWFFYGRREGRRIPAQFDVHYYRTRYPDIVVIFGDDLYGSWLHYLDWGINEGRVFDPLFRLDDYLILNQDLAPIIGTDREAAVLHWLYFGKAAGRKGRY